MDIDPMEAASEAEGVARSKETARLSTLVAVTVALIATFLGVCKVKDDNIVQAMQQAQANKLDDWNFYQARNVREDVAVAAASQLKLAAAAAPPAQQAAYHDAIASFEKRAADEAAKKEPLRLRAEQDQRDYDALNYKDDQFDLCDTLIALAISLLALTALTHKRWLYALALIPTLGGILMGLAGLLGWHLHPDMLASLLS